MKPVILLTPQYEDRADTVSLRIAYTNAIIRSGGIPLTLSLEMADEDIAPLLELADGLLLTGGDDVAPSLYGDIKSPKCGKVSRLRDEFEIKVIRQTIVTDLPTLGICRGIQIMNVALGGSLYQDIPSHMQGSERDKPSHDILLTASPISDIYPRYAQVNSFHHQSVKALGEGLEVFARADDGIIEGIFHKNKSFFVGVQWHPEHMKDKYAEDLFARFIEKAHERKNKNDKRACEKEQKLSSIQEGFRDKPRNPS